MEWLMGLASRLEGNPPQVPTSGLQPRNVSGNYFVSTRCRHSPETAKRRDTDNLTLISEAPAGERGLLVCPGRGDAGEAFYPDREPCRPKASRTVHGPKPATVLDRDAADRAMNTK
jgi:hypothetical protein